MNAVEQRWLDHAWEVVNCPDEHIAACETAGGARTSQHAADGNELRWPGYLGRRYSRDAGILCVAHVHREPAPQSEREDEVTRRTNAALVAAHRTWLHKGRSPRSDSAFLDSLHTAYQEALPHWNRWRTFGKLVDALGLDVTQVAWANLAKCRVPQGRSPESVVRLCQMQFPIAQVLDAIRPLVVLVCAMQARPGGTLGIIWRTSNCQPRVWAWHGRNGVDSENRPSSQWLPEAVAEIRRLLAAR